MPNFFAVILSVILSALLANIASAQKDSTEKHNLIEIGKLIYQQGILPNGKALTGIGPSNIKLSGIQASCIRCHRRSGFGSIEGDLRISPILGEILYKDRNKSYKELKYKRTKGRGARPAYTTDTLKKAITKGSGADNRILEALMPRYKLNETEITAVIAYLKSLTLTNSPGITDNTIHIATIYSSEVAEQEISSMLDLLNIYFKDVNAQTRKEKRRATNSPWHKRWEYESYRTIKLHSWQLTGSPSTWKKQLQSHYNKQNVFAIVNGISNFPWDVIHNFCNRIELPCLFPTTSLPDLSKNNIYNFYFSGGIINDAKTIASHISNFSGNSIKSVLQIHRDSAKNNTAVNVLKIQLLTNNINNNSYLVTEKESLSVNHWSKIIKRYKPTIIISWLSAKDLRALNSMPINDYQIDRFYYSYSHLGKQYPDIIKTSKEKSYIVYRYMLPQRQKLHIVRATVWAKRKNINISKSKIIGNAFFSATLFNRAVKKMRSYLNQDYLVEIIERMLENNAFQSVYPALSLGPDQRIASKGAYILGPLNNRDVNKKENHIWIRH